MPNGKILYEGYLEKKEKKWEAFWVRLIDSRLYFYQEKYVPTQKFHGFLELSGSCQCSTHKSRKSKYQFKIKTDKGVFLFQTITEDERTAWMAKILQARDSRVRSISTGNLCNHSKHSDPVIWSRRRPSSATGVPSSRSSEKNSLVRPCSAESASKSQIGLSDRLGTTFTPRNRSASCNDVPIQPPPLHMDTHPTLRRKHENYTSKSPTDTSKRSKFFSLSGFKQLSGRFSKSQENVGDRTILRENKKIRDRRAGSLNLEVTEGSKTNRAKDYLHEQEDSVLIPKRFPPRSASVCSDQSTTSKLSAHSTVSLDRKSKKRKDKHSFAPEKNTDVISAKTGVNKLSGIRCQLNGSVPVPVTQHAPTTQQTKFHTSDISDTYKSPNNNPANLHSSFVAKKPPTPSRHVTDTVHYENELRQTTQSDSSFSATKPPRPPKSDTLQNGQDKLGPEDRSADLRENEKNRSRQHRKNPFYENETAMYDRFSWFHGDLTREDAENMLKFCGKVGSFLIRNSKKHSKHLCLSLRYSDRIRHFKIDRSTYGYSIDGLEGHYSHLNKLVEVFITWNDNMVKPLDKVTHKQVVSEHSLLETESLIYEDMADDVI